MENKGRKTRKNLRAGNRLKIAVGVLSNSLHITLEDLIQMPEWKETREKNGCDLPVTKKTITNWFENGIPEEKSKVNRVSEFLKLPVNIFLHDSEQYFLTKFYESWDISCTNEKNDDENNNFLSSKEISLNILQHHTKEILQTISTCASEWEKSEYQYMLIEKYGQNLKLYTLNHKLLHNSVTNDNLHAFIILISIHFNAGWEFWAKHNKDNEIAISQMVKSLRLKYWRVRFRVLYSLQYSNKYILKRKLAINENLLSKRTNYVIENYVFRNNVVEYLKNVSKDSTHIIRNKANEVLTEIS